MRVTNGGKATLVGLGVAIALFWLSAGTESEYPLWACAASGVFFGGCWYFGMRD
jgi:hypothetical protein